MNTLKKIWDWVNGKKTMIGVALLVGTEPFFALISEPFSILKQPTPACFPMLIALCLWAGKSIGTIGGIHKLIKMKADVPAA